MVWERIGWGGRIRTFTVLINSEVSYQLDHAPAVIGGCFKKREAGGVSARTATKNIKRIPCQMSSARVESVEVVHKEFLLEHVRSKFYFAN
jgi:hypothetical protein